MPGWIGRLLRINLSEGKVQVDPLDAELRQLYIGGRGAAAKLLYDEVDPRVDPFAPENKLVFATGPLTGSGAITGCKELAACKSPPTGGLGPPPARGGFGPG